MKLSCECNYSGTVGSHYSITPAEPATWSATIPLSFRILGSDPKDTVSHFYRSKIKEVWYLEPGQFNWADNCQKRFSLKVMLQVSQSRLGVWKQSRKKELHFMEKNLWVTTLNFNLISVWLFSKCINPCSFKSYNAIC